LDFGLLVFFGLLWSLVGLWAWSLVLAVCLASLFFLSVLCLSSLALALNPTQTLTLTQTLSLRLRITPTIT
jgi:hypothetical protein